MRTSIFIRRNPLVLAACAWMAGCGAPAADAAELCALGQRVTGAIVGGAPTGQQAFGAVGAIVATDRHGRTISICTGTLIAPDVVVTAAHCLVAQGAQNDARLLWFSTDHDVSQLTKARPVQMTQTLVHPDFAGDGPIEVPLAWRRAQDDTEARILADVFQTCGAPEKPLSDQAFWQCVIGLPPDVQRRLGLMDGAVNMGDVGLGLLGTPLTDAPLALLPTAATAPLWPTQAMQVVGYGVYDAPDAKAKRGLRHQGVVALDGIGHFELQVGFATAQVAFGDSGGPLFAAGDVAQELVGIASRSLVDAEGHVKGPTLYARTTSFTPWIRQALRDACRQNLRTADMCRLHPF